MSKVILVDGNAIGHAANYATKLTSGDMETQAAYGFLNTMRDLHVSYPQHQVVVLWDGRAQWRFDLHPNYKSNRDNDPKKVKNKESYNRQKPYIEQMMTHLGVRQMLCSTHEADDLAGYLVGSLSKPGNEIILITGDQDWIQLIRPGVKWIDPRQDDRKVTVANLFDKTAYKTPYAFLEGKCLMGDTSDVVPGVGGIGEKGAPEFIAEFGSVREFWRRCDAGEFVPKKVAHKNLSSPEGRMRFKRNFKLMQLLKPQLPAQENCKRFGRHFDSEAFAKVCEDLAFISILRKLEQFVEPFKEQ